MLPREAPVQPYMCAEMETAIVDSKIQDHVLKLEE
jgi:hypothetical protein